MRLLKVSVFFSASSPSTVNRIAASTPSPSPSSSHAENNSTTVARTPPLNSSWSPISTGARIMALHFCECAHVSREGSTPDKTAPSSFRSITSVGSDGRSFVLGSEAPAGFRTGDPQRRASKTRESLTMRWASRGISETIDPKWRSWRLFPLSSMSSSLDSPLGEGNLAILSSGRSYQTELMEKVGGSGLGKMASMSRARPKSLSESLPSSACVDISNVNSTPSVQ
mmetsp:Transcript_35628/g.68782  ORF Transcript_35628/g.68782 Transcript_35628/m.68782 type:complete len:226 (-) Transcript_35628:580-1257(-)